MTAPWRTNFLAGFRAIPGLVSLGTFFASNESTSATPKAFKKLAAKAKIILKQMLNLQASKERTSATPKAFRVLAAKAKTIIKNKIQRANRRSRQANAPAAKAK